MNDGRALQQIKAAAEASGFAAKSKQEWQWLAAQLPSVFESDRTKLAKELAGYADQIRKQLMVDPSCSLIDVLNSRGEALCSLIDVDIGWIRGKLKILAVLERCLNPESRKNRIRRDGRPLAEYIVSEMRLEVDEFFCTLVRDVLKLSRDAINIGAGVSGNILQRFAMIFLHPQFRQGRAISLKQCQAALSVLATETAHLPWLLTAAFTGLDLALQRARADSALQSQEAERRLILMGTADRRENKAPATYQIADQVETLSQLIGSASPMEMHLNIPLQAVERCILGNNPLTEKLRRIDGITLHWSMRQAARRSMVIIGSMKENGQKLFELGAIPDFVDKHYAALVQGYNALGIFAILAALDFYHRKCYQTKILSYFDVNTAEHFLQAHNLPPQYQAGDAHWGESVLADIVAAANASDLLFRQSIAAMKARNM
jgi:hypothetical protein